MLASIRSEYRKLLTVRSTYIIIGIIFLFMMIFAFYAQGMRSAAGVGGHVISQAIVNGTNIAAALAAVIGLLMVTHEYRYNTIMYTLTSSNSRVKSLLAKIFVLTTFSIFVTFFFGALIPLLIYLGSSIAHVTLDPQTIYYRDILWQALFTGWGNMMYAVILSVFIRHQVGAIIAYFIIPSTVEPLVGIVLKDNSMYLPYTLLAHVTNIEGPIANSRAALIVLGYIVGASILAFFAFKKRDAN